MIETGGTKKTVHVPGIGWVDDFMISDNLNECVDALLQKRPKPTKEVANSPPIIEVKSSSTKA